MVRKMGNIRFEDEESKSILVCDLFYKITMDITRPLPETKSRNKYILVAIDHYSKWCEAKAVANHGAKITTRFLKYDKICRYGVPKFVLTDNGGEWVQSLMSCARTMGFTINIQHPNGHSAMGWLNV
jgi:hypothetical protein